MIGLDTYRIVIEFPEPNSPASADYRYSPIHVVAINTDNIPNFKTMSLEPLQGQYLGEGNIRLFREFEADDSAFPSPELSPKQSAIESIPSQVLGDETMVSIVAVPTYFTATDLLGFIGEEYMSSITHIRILKSEKPNRFLVLIKFNDIVRTAEFQYTFNGKPFNSMEPESCHVVFVSSVSMTNQDKLQSADSLTPFLLSDPFTSLNTNSSIELPTCPVCLERMDYNITGLLTIPCQHTFHCLCLSKWKDDTCPICRYSNDVSNQKIRRSIRRLLQYRQRTSSSSEMARVEATSSSMAAMSIDEEQELCADCLIQVNLWICLICGNMGCDRYAPDQHSLKHFINTGHCFAMELETSRVWDYAGDNYVHRLVTNEADGKLVELPEKLSSTSGSSANKGSDFDKVDEVGFEYSQLLISQLASQREYYEGLLRRGSDVSRDRPEDLELVVQLQKTVRELQDEVNETIPTLKSKIASKDRKLQTLSRDLNEANRLNDGLSEKVDYLMKANETLQATNADLSDQVKDLMFFLESREKFKDEPQDVQDGTIVIQDKKKKKKPKKK